MRLRIIAASFAVTATGLLCGSGLAGLSTSSRLAAVAYAEQTAQNPTQGGTMVTTPTGLKYIDKQVGTGAEAVKGKSVTVHYTGKLANGKKFDSSLDRNDPFVFTLGAGQVIKGWDEGVAGMKVGGKRDLIIPAKLGYGDRGAGGVIPPGAELHFEVELIAISK
jgi:FKBP-type peptidyl-prolyl cis-trans isomerase